MESAAETKFHVLAVDDSLIDRKLIERLLLAFSFRVTIVDSGSKALELLGLQEEESSSSLSSTLSDNQEEVNLVITDYCMPGMTGFDLLKRIKETSSLKNIPVVIMSSENEPSRINMCLEEGAEEFLLKPVQMSDLEKIRPYLIRRKSVEPDEKTQLSSSAQVSSEKDGSTSLVIATDVKGSESSGKRKAIDEGIPCSQRRQRCTVTA